MDLNERPVQIRRARKYRRKVLPNKAQCPFQDMSPQALSGRAKQGADIMLSDAVFGDGHNKVTDKVP